MSLVDHSGKPIDISKAQFLGDEMNTYEIGEVKLSTPEVPQTILAKAVEQAKGFLMQQGQIAAASQANPFQFEPCALAVFMMLSNEIKRLNAEIEALKGDGGQTS